MAGANLQSALVMVLLLTLPLNGGSLRAVQMSGHLQNSRRAERPEMKFETLRRELLAPWRKRVMEEGDYKRLVPGGPDPQHHSAPQSAP